MAFSSGGVETEKLRVGASFTKLLQHQAMQEKRSLAVPPAAKKSIVLISVDMVKRQSVALHFQTGCRFLLAVGGA